MKEVFAFVPVNESDRVPGLALSEDGATGYSVDKIQLNQELDNVGHYKNLPDALRGLANVMEQFRPVRFQLEV